MNKQRKRKVEAGSLFTRRVTVTVKDASRFVSAASGAHMIHSLQRNSQNNVCPAYIETHRLLFTVRDGVFDLLKAAMTYTRSCP